ncbi:MAG: hypothetical protein EZS28_028377 [Streblomastix strix]|uniref:Uncharacterized protein n=1 Tax=Streblomastix strix TaxID=222440 RepID=A0A5J4UZE3_9EUKA|nr:MAG: hypothetical protein EZS28_028377 [Streblomastix strix]
MTSNQQKIIEKEIIRYSPEISRYKTLVGTFGLISPKTGCQIYHLDFPNSLLEDLYETNIRINNEGRIIQEKYMEIAQRNEENTNPRFDQPSTNLGFTGPLVTEEQQMNELQNSGSQKQKEKESKQLSRNFPSNNQEDLPDSSIYPDTPPEQTIAQENFTERERQQIQSAILLQGNLNSVYDIGTLDWDRHPINDIYGRSPLETHQSGYKYDFIQQLSSIFGETSCTSRQE